MLLKQIKNTSKKTGNPYTAYQFEIGDWKTPFFFINNQYEKQHMIDSCKEEGIDYDGE